MLTRHSPLHGLGRAEAGWFRGESQIHFAVDPTTGESHRGCLKFNSVQFSRGKKKKGRGLSLPLQRARTAAVQTVVLDLKRHTGILPGRTFRTPITKLEPSTRGPPRRPNDAGPRHRWS